MSNSLEERLRSNSNAFDGLLSLIPAKYYYDDKTQEQWKATKKSKSQAKIDKRRKLNPEEQEQETFSALEVKKQREKDAKPVVLPGEKLKIAKEQQKQAEDEEVSDKVDEEGDEDVDNDKISVVFDDEGNQIVEGTSNTIEENSDKDENIDETSSAQDKEVKNDRNINSVLSNEQKIEKQRKMEELRAKLQEKIQAMKERRKAPGTRVEGAPSSREAILAQRKKKVESRKRKLEEEKQRTAAGFGDESDSESDSDLDGKPPQKKPYTGLEVDASGVIFQSIMFDDGAKATSDLQRFRKGDRKGPSKKDVKSHLLLAEKKKAALESKDELQQIMIKEREKWKKAVLQAEGVRMKDDEKLLRKALKRKEAKKRKSAIDWKDREQQVTNFIAEKQKRREENLAIRRENKGKKKNKQQKMKRKLKSVIVPKKRAGFEGRLKSGKKK